MEIPDCCLLIRPHFLEFGFVNSTLDRVRLGFRVPSPDFALHVVLEQHRWHGYIGRNIDGGVQEITNRDIEAALLICCLQESPNLCRREPPYGIWRVIKSACNVVNSSSKASHSFFAGTYSDSSGEMLLQLFFVYSIWLTFVVRQKNQLVLSPKTPCNMIGPDVTTATDGKQLVRLNPKDLHRTSPACKGISGLEETHSTFLPTTQFKNATAAAKFSITNVRAASAARPSKPLLKM